MLSVPPPLWATEASPFLSPPALWLRSRTYCMVGESVSPWKLLDYNLHHSWPVFMLAGADGSLTQWLRNGGTGVVAPGAKRLGAWNFNVYRCPNTAAHFQHRAQLKTDPREPGSGSSRQGNDSAVTICWVAQMPLGNWMCVHTSALFPPSQTPHTFAWTRVLANHAMPLARFQHNLECHRFPIPGQGSLGQEH